MNKVVRSISAWLLALVMIVSGFSVFGSFGPATANADVDNTKLVLKVTNQYGQPAEGVGFDLKSTINYPDVNLEKSDSNGIINMSVSDKQLFQDYTLELASNSKDNYSITSGETTISFGEENFKSVVDSVNGKDYTGEISITVNDKNATSPSEPSQPSEPTKPTATKATTDEVKAYMSDSDSKTVLLDARSVDAYNGWAIGDAERGGHLKNAVSFPANAIKNAQTPSKAEGTTVDDYHNQMIGDAGITKDSKIIIYDVNDSDADYVFQWLVQKGYSADNMKIFNATSMINSGKYKVEKYKNYDLYVPAEVVKNISDNLTNKADEYTKNAKKVVNGDDVVILDVSWGDEKVSGYDAGHIPGAVHVNTDEYETPKVYVKSKPKAYRSEWRLNSDKELIALAEKNGIKMDSCVVIAGPEPMATTRMAIILKYLGVENVHVMSNAMTDWNAAGYSMETGINHNTKTSLGITKAQNPDVIDTTTEVKKELKNSKYAIIDTRTKDEWDGKSSGYTYHDLKGRIPGTIYSNCGRGNSNSVFYYRNADKSMRNGEAIKNMWKKAGIDYQNKHMVFFCGSGWRAAETTWEAWLMGYDASLYSDGWLGWSNDGNNYVRGGKTYAMDQKTGKEVNLTAISSAKITKVKAKAGKKKATVTYGKKSGVTGYKVYYRQAKKGTKYKLAKTTSSRKVTIKKLKKHKKYYVRVRGYKKINGRTVYTKYSKTVKVRAK